MEAVMGNKVLVAYASKYGGTAEIAEKIGEVLREEGLMVDVHAVADVKNLPGYDAVVLGSGVYMGQWRKKAGTFLKANENLLTQKPVWLYSSGPTGEGDIAELMQGWDFPNGLKPLADRVKPRGMAIFHGVLSEEKLNFVEKWVLKNVKAPVGDFRDWKMITDWAKEIAKALKAV